ncbi:AAA family ATPase [candidate division KSB1 bacterium]|nr:AAA family ATPase [candidate division KSB1 bacterium]
MIRILISDTLKKYLLRQPLSMRKKLQQKIEYLEIGYWDGGLMVKKLRGVGREKAIFEARMDRSNRLLFSLGRDVHPDSGISDLLVYAWGIVGHDKIHAGSESIPADVPFLKFTPFDTVSLTDTSFEEIDDEFVSQQSITEPVDDESGVQKWHPLTAAEWSRLQRYEQGVFELMLYLTPQQQQLLQTPLPLFISGTAGSGKTTLAVYRLLQSEFVAQRKLFITYNRYLRDYAKQLYEGLLTGLPDQTGFQAAEFFTFLDFCRSIADPQMQRFADHRRVTLERFMAWLREQRLAGSNDAPMIWEEIRSIIKGALPQLRLQPFQRAMACKQGAYPAPLVNALKEQLYTLGQLSSMQKLDDYARKYVQMDLIKLSRHLDEVCQSGSSHVQTFFQRALQILTKERQFTELLYLSFADYEALGQKKAPNFAEDRKRIYEIFQRYQDWLHKDHLWDELDLSRAAMAQLQGQKESRWQYDLVVCDEIQDLSDIQHELLLHSARHASQVLLCGDSKQIINPSGFRWEELRRHFFERNLPVPEMHYLNLNFRCSGSIVELSNVLLQLKARLLGSRAEEKFEEWKFKGRPPVIVNEIKESTMRQHVQLTGARRTILVRHDQEKQRLQKALDTELVFTIHEAKGMEFDTVLLWRFMDDLGSKDVWKTILDPSHQQTHPARVRHEINLLYVAITRAQKELLIYDGEKPSLLWKSDEIKPFVFLSNDMNYIEGIWNTISSPREWKEQGDYFFEREHYRAARECYKNANETHLFLRADAFEARRQGQHERAGQRFKELGELALAAEHFEKAGVVGLAIELYHRCKDKAAIERCQPLLLRQQGDLKSLAEWYLQHKEYRAARDVYVEIRQWGAAADLSLKRLDDRQAAAEYYERDGQWHQAADLFKRLKHIEKAAELYERAGAWEPAEKQWIKLKRTDKLRDLYRKSGQDDKLFDLFEKQKQFDHAFKVLQRLGRSEKELRREGEELLEKRRYRRALLRFELVDAPAESALCYEKTKQVQKAAPLYESVGDYEQAAQAYKKCGNWTKMAWMALRIKKSSAVRGRLLRYAELRVSPGDYRRMAEKLEEIQDWSAAADAYGLIYEWDKKGICHAEAGNFEQATNAWENCIYDEFRLNAIAHYAFQSAHRDEICRFLLTHLPHSYEVGTDLFLDGHAGEPQAYLQLIDEYFDQHDDPGLLARWGHFLLRIPVYYDIEPWKEKIFLKWQDYTVIFNYYNNIAKYNSAHWNDIKTIWNEHKASYIQNPGFLSALKLYFLGEQNEFEKMMAALDYQPNAYKLFLLSSRKQEVFEQLEKSGDVDRMIHMHVADGNFLSAGRLSEKAGDHHQAASLYEKAKAHGLAAMAWLHAEEFEKAAQAYYRAGQFEKAFDLLNKHNLNLPRQAYCLQKMHRWAEAMQIWQKLGRKERIRHCRRMVENTDQLDLF